MHTGLCTCLHSIDACSAPQHLHALLGCCIGHGLIGIGHRSFLVCTMQAVWYETAQYACLQECVCPSGGGPCAPSSHCSTKDFACKHSYKRFSDHSPRCYPVGCREGALQVPFQSLLTNLSLLPRHFCVVHNGACLLAGLTKPYCPLMHAD